VICGVDIEVSLRTVDAVLEVIPRERMADPGAKMSTLALCMWGRSQCSFGSRDQGEGEEEEEEEGKGGLTRTC
jgi:hypothetical protein